MLGKAGAELKIGFFLSNTGPMSTMSISQLNCKKVSPPGLSLSFSDLVLTVFPDALINATYCR